MMKAVLAAIVSFCGVLYLVYAPSGAVLVLDLADDLHTQQKLLLTCNNDARRRGLASDAVRQCIDERGFRSQSQGANESSPSSS